MGIQGLWDILHDGEITSIAQLASEHFTRHGRPLRIAVDEAGWRFSNLTTAQAEAIRNNEPAARPIEKAILWRVLKLMRHNIQLIFIFDGPRRPWKRGRGAGRVDRKCIDLLIELLDHLEIPHHRAPAEAEAECARLQHQGVVDAVWSEDGDCLMFGCGLLLRNYRVNGKKSETDVRVHRSETIARDHGLDCAGLVLFALLSGGDYDTAGLQGVGPQGAMRAVRAGLGKRLFELSAGGEQGWKYDGPIWRQELSQCLRREVPHNFPLWRNLNNYKNPVVSGPKQLFHLRGLQNGWDMPIDQAKLRIFLRERFNFWTRGFINHLAPALLIKTLASTEPGMEASNRCYDVQPVPIKKKTTLEAIELARFEKTITFRPEHLFIVDITTEPKDDEDWSIFNSKDRRPWDPLQRIKCEVPIPVLRRGIGEAFMEQKPPEKTKAPVSRKRKGIGNQDGSASQSSAKKRVSQPKSEQCMPADRTATKSSSKQMPSAPLQEMHANTAILTTSSVVAKKPVFKMPPLYDDCFIDLTAD